MKKALMLNRVPSPAVLAQAARTTTASLQVAARQAAKPTATGVRRARHRPATFLRGLVALLSEERTIVYKDGNLYMKDPVHLECEVLHRYFKQTTIASFLRQLNYFGFRKVSFRRGPRQPSVFHNVALEGRPVEGILDLKRRTCVRDVANAADADTMNYQLPTNAIAAPVLVGAMVKWKETALLTDEVMAMATAAQPMPPPNPMQPSARIRAGFADPSPVEDASCAALSHSVLLQHPPRASSHQLAIDCDGGGSDCGGGVVAPFRSCCAIVAGTDNERGCIPAATPAAKTSRDTQTKSATAAVASAPGAGDAAHSSLLPISKRKRFQNKVGADLIRARRGRLTSGVERSGSVDDIKRDENDQMIPTIRNTDARDAGAAYRQVDAAAFGGGESRNVAFGETYRQHVVLPRSRRGGSFVDGAGLNPWSIESGPHSMSSGGGQRPGETGQMAMDSQRVAVLDPGDRVGASRCAENRGGGGYHLNQMSLGCDKYSGGLFFECDCQSNMEHQMLLPKLPTGLSPPRFDTVDISEIVDDTGFTAGDSFAEWPGHNRDCSGLGASEIACCSQFSATVAFPISTVRNKQHHLQEHHQQEEEQQRRRQRQLEQAVSSCCCSILPIHTWHLGSGRFLREEAGYDEFAPRSVVMDQTYGGDFGTAGDVSPQFIHQSLIRPAAYSTPTTFLNFRERASSPLHTGNMASTFSYSSPPCYHQHPRSACGATTSGIQGLDTFMRNTTREGEDQHANGRASPSEIARRASSHEGGHVGRGGDDSTLSISDARVVHSLVNREQSPDARFGVFRAVNGKVLSEDLQEMCPEELVLTQRREAELIDRACAGGSGSGVDVRLGISSSDIVGDTACFTKGVTHLASSTGSCSAGECTEECRRPSTFITSTRCDKQLHLQTKIDQKGNRHTISHSALMPSRRQLQLSSIKSVDGVDSSVISSTSLAVTPVSSRPSQVALSDLASQDDRASLFPASAVSLDDLLLLLK